MVEIIEYQDGAVRCLCWKLANQGWIGLSETIDTFLVECFQLAVAAYEDKPIAWVELNTWPGRLIFYPSDDGPFGDRNERILLQLCSDYLDFEWDKTCKMPNGAVCHWEPLNAKLWSRIGECLTRGKAAEALWAGRMRHPMKLAAYEFEPGEGIFQLPELNASVTAELKQQLAAYRERVGIVG